MLSFASAGVTGWRKLPWGPVLMAVSPPASGLGVDARRRGLPVPACRGDVTPAEALRLRRFLSRS